MDPIFAYKLYHIREKEDGEEDAKLIGIYTSEDKAKDAIQRVIGQPGFRDYPDGFHICRHQLDKDSWTQGFTSTDEAEEPYR